MRKAVLIATAAAVLLGGLQVPASAAAPDAPTDVQISWADGTLKSLRITWKDNGEANSVSYEIDGMVIPLTMSIAQQAAGGSNEVIVKAGIGDVKKARYTVWSKDAAGVASSRTPSVWFDNQRPSVPVLTDAVPQPDQSLKLTWNQPAIVDITPNDPLDRPASEEALTAGVLGSGTGGPAEQFQLPAGSTTWTVPPRPRPYPVRIQVANEWGTKGPTKDLIFGNMTAGLRIDAVAKYTTQARFDMLAGAQLCLVPGPCAYTSAPGQPSWLQSRLNATQPWKTIGRYAQGAEFSGGVGSYGGMEFRTFVPAWKQLNPGLQYPFVVTPEAASPARYSATSAQYLAAGLDKTSALVGQPVQVTVSVRPLIGGNASLQYWTGTAWKHTAYIPLTKGIGRLTFKAAGRGTTKTFRISLPKLVWDGKPFVPTTSQGFKLTVR